MKSVDSFNGLNGRKATREEIAAQIVLAGKQEQYHIAAKLQQVLDSYPESKEFYFDIENPACEIVSRSSLECLDCEAVAEEFAGLGKAVSPTEIYDMISARMKDMIKEANAYGYEKRWEGQFYGSGYLVPFNFSTKKRYRGVNVLLLTEFGILSNPFFMTFKQVEEMKGKVRKGAKGFPVVYFTELYKVVDVKREIDFGSYSKEKALKFADENGIDAKEVYKIPILKYYNVFNGKDIEDIDFDLENFKVGYIEKEIPSDEEKRMPIPEAILKNYPSPVPPLRFGGDRAYYSPSHDHIQMPYLSDFETVQDYYRTLFHEIGHSTGHPKRLDRDFSGRMKGSAAEKKKYAFEELIAEWSATFLSAEAGIIWHNNINHAAYLKNWNLALTHIENDNRFVMRACTEAQKAADYILQLDENGDPLYFNDIKKITEEIKKEEKPKKTAKAKQKAEEIETEAEIVAPVKPKAQKSQTVQPRKESPAERRNAKNKKTKPESGQMALFGTKPESTSEAIQSDSKKDFVPGSLAHELSKPAQAYEYYDIRDAEISEFLGRIEKKKRESLAITLAGGQGSMKTRMLFRMMNAFGQNYRCGHASIEEHPQSAIYKSKVDQYLNQKAKENIFAPEIGSIEDLHALIEQCDVVFIDSFPKLQEMCRGFELDKDLRKKYDGKLFVVIYQLTGDGKMRGGSKSQFDGDIILLTEAFPDYTRNVVYANKNRYQDRPLHELKYNIYKGKIEKEAPKEIAVPKETAFSFDVLEY
ncbi:zincin-like metallopeptidase domain-containing protein [Flavobacterium sp. WW92]|uniref:ArdC family protein n=1 Tax=unclassified Flavobacterium TaxID=196869 RepID=UPI002224937E|nr:MULTISPECIES: zincin-like metallopeptidase domain-containing protein [unclassified Flavobacterium]WDO13048.1 zincin-like metallopeptidase domain-containing protein [Flavobacterium sp. WW92]